MTPPQVFNVNTVDLAAKCAAALGASKLVYIADGSYLEDTLTGITTCLQVFVGLLPLSTRRIQAAENAFLLL